MLKSWGDIRWHITEIMRDLREDVIDYKTANAHSSLINQFVKSLEIEMVARHHSKQDILLVDSEESEQKKRGRL
jgi:hypothetical protein